MDLEMLTRLALGIDDSEVGGGGTNDHDFSYLAGGGGGAASRGPSLFSGGGQAGQDIWPRATPEEVTERSWSAFSSAFDSNTNSFSSGPQDGSDDASGGNCIRQNDTGPTIGGRRPLYRPPMW
jgi:hypothetical protein